MTNSSDRRDPEPTEYQVVIPEECYQVMNWEIEGLPCVGVINSALKNFEPKIVFGWHLSLILDFQDLIQNGMPSEEERAIVDPFCDKLDDDIKAGGNALFLARETWNKTRRLVWRVYDPEIAHAHLQYLIEYKQHPRPFDYHMEDDLEWKEAQWYFDQIPT